MRFPWLKLFPGDAEGFGRLDGFSKRAFAANGGARSIRSNARWDLGPISIIGGFSRPVFIYITILRRYPPISFGGEKDEKAGLLFVDDGVMLVLQCRPCGAQSVYR